MIITLRGATELLRQAIFGPPTKPIKKQTDLEQRYKSRGLMTKKITILWSEEDRGQLVELIKAGVSVTRATIILGQTTHSLQAEARHFGQPFPTLYERRWAMSFMI